MSKRFALTAALLAFAGVLPICGMPVAGASYRRNDRRSGFHRPTPKVVFPRIYVGVQ